MIPAAALVLTLTLVELILAVGLLVLLMAGQLARDPQAHERLGSIAARVTVPTIVAILVLGLVIALDGAL